MYQNPYGQGIFIMPIISGAILDRFSRKKMPAGMKFYIAMGVYIIIGVFEGSYMYLPVGIAMALSFCVGIGGVTSYTIRVSSTQSYVPDEKKCRFAGLCYSESQGWKLCPGDCDIVCRDCYGNWEWSRLRCGTYVVRAWNRRNSHVFCFLAKTEKISLFRDYIIGE